MWELIIGAILKYIGLWFDSKQKQALQWQVRTLKGKLSSAVQTHKIEKKIRSARPVSRSVTPVAWNRRAKSTSVPLGLLFLFVTLIPCCAPVFIESPWPIIETTARPVVPEHPPEWTRREVILVDYAEELELRIEVYNDLATEHNIESNYEDD